ncbi:MAG: NUDIX domain-containing protein [Sedimentisphaerales bacterium]|nr:NUDIX domain-containing protein [Sedimentisphaerales bacterium]
MAQDEQVLVIERSVYERAGTFHGLAMDVDRYIEQIFAPGVTRYMPRSQAETDPCFKQVIPYVLMTCDGKYLSYVRGKRAGETRLVGNRSIGIGGHINPTDDMSLFDPYETYLNAVRREVEEEVNVETKHSDRVIALLNDDTNEVGRVHLGIVHLWTLDEPNVTRREQMITQMGFMTLEELSQVRDTMETWSQLCLDGLEEMAREQSGV